MTKSVLIAIPVLLVGGTEMQMLTLVNVLIGAGYKVTVCCYYEYNESMVSRFKKTGAEVLLLKNERAMGLWHLAKGLMKLFKTIKPDIVHVQYIAPGLATVLAARFAGIKTVYATVHQPGRVYGLKEKLFLRTAALLCTAFFCVSRSVEASWFGDSELFDPQRFSKGRRHFTVYNGVDIEKIATAVNSTDKDALINELDLTGHKIIGFVGRLRTEKGLNFLIDALPHILKSHPDAMLLVVGDGPDGQMLRKKVEDLKLSSHVRWLGQKTPEEVYQLYSIMDVVAVPSFFEGFGLVAAEAQAAELPVVATRVDGLTEVIENDVTGILVPAGDSSTLASALTDLLSDMEKAREMGQKGRERVREIFSMERFGQTILSAYRELA